VAWIQVVQGSLQLNEQQLYPADGVAIKGPRSVVVTASSDCEALLFDMSPEF
jgi:redox-sensitive bicupin YhaK (pirin superfamily)